MTPYKKNDLNPFNVEIINDSLEIPSATSSSPIKPEEARFIYDFLVKNKITSTCETGFAIGRSASHIMAATNSKHISIDPFQDYYDNSGLKNIKKLGMDHLLDFRPDFSHNVLPQLHKEGRTFEFIFIDGDHKFDGILVDFYFADLLCKQGGYLLFHDTWMRTTALVAAFIKKNRPDYEVVATPLRNFHLIKKVGKDERNGMHFKGFYNFKSILTHKVIIWLTSGEKTGLRKFVYWLKDKVK